MRVLHVATGPAEMPQGGRAGAIAAALGAWTDTEPLALGPRPSRAERARLCRIVRDHAPDVVILGDVALAPLVRRLRAFGPAVVLDTNNAVVGGFFLPYRGMREADGVWVAAEADAAPLRGRVAPEALLTVPNAVDLGEYPRSAGWDEGAPTIGVAGDFGRRDHERAALTLIDCSRRLEGMGIRHRLHLFGGPPTRAMRAAAQGIASVEVSATRETRSYLARSSLVAVPPGGGAGMRLVLLEALAFGRPVVAGRDAAQGIACDDRRDAIIVDDAGSFFHALTQLVIDRDLRRSVGAAGRCWVEGNASLGALAEVLRRGLATAIERRSGTR